MSRGYFVHACIPVLKVQTLLFPSGLECFDKLNNIYNVCRWNFTSWCRLFLAYWISRKSIIWRILFFFFPFRKGLSVSSRQDPLSSNCQHEEWHADLLGCCSQPYLCTFFSLLKLCLLACPRDRTGKCSSFTVDWLEFVIRTATNSCIIYVLRKNYKLRLLSFTPL